MTERTRLIYNLGLEKLKGKLNVLNLEYKIEHIKFRFKTDISIKGKLERKEKLVGKHLECTDENIKNYIKDVIGARIVCPFILDIKELVEDLLNDSEIEILEIKDYINSPKPNGYSGYHIIIRIPIVIDEKVEYVNAEIQIRTIMQDMLASQEHKIRYKKNIELSDQTNEKLQTMIKECNTKDKNLNEKYKQAKLANEIIFQNAEYTKMMLKHQMALDITSASYINQSDETYKVNEPYVAEFGIQENKIDNENLFQNIDYKKMMIKYQTALDIISAYINQLNEIYKVNEQYFEEVNPIEHIEKRRKKYERIIEKVKKQTNNLSPFSIENTISDIAGIRIVCSFKYDLYKVINTLKNDFELQVIREKNYIENPKENGYKGYHLIVLIPVSIENRIEYVKVEIQVRTIAMDTWAILERNLRSIKMTPQERKKELCDLAYIRDKIDDNMQEISLEARNLIANKKVLKKSPIK